MSIEYCTFNIQHFFSTIAHPYSIVFARSELPDGSEQRSNPQLVCHAEPAKHLLECYWFICLLVYWFRRLVSLGGLAQLFRCPLALVDCRLPLPTDCAQQFFSKTLAQNCVNQKNSENPDTKNVSTNFFLKKLPQNCGRKNCGNKIKREMAGTNTALNYRWLPYYPYAGHPPLAAKPFHVSCGRN